MPALVASLMSSPVLSLPANRSALEALCLAEALGVHHFPVYENGRLLGVVCTCDLEMIPIRAPIKRALERPPVSIDIRANWLEAARILHAERIGLLLVRQEGHVVGILTREDLTRAGFDSVGDPDFNCKNCGAVTHLRRTAEKDVLCLDCRAHRGVGVRSSGS